jgi:putative transposase
MSRPLRIHYENACYHVTCRGNAREDIFGNDADRERFLALLERSLEIYQIKVMVFALMRNHFLC